MSTEIICMHFNDGLHIGRGSDELDRTATIFSSDALKSALYAIGLQYFPEWADDAKAYFEGFRISSAFPFCGDEYFLPKPASMRFDFAETSDLLQAKVSKKINYVSTSLFNEWVSDPDLALKVNERQVGDGTYLFHQHNARKFIHTSVQQRVAVPAEGAGDTRPFYFERLLFSGESGLYFIINFINEELKPKLMLALRLLADAGIGTDRTVGNGQFSVEERRSFVIPNAQKQGLQMALGLFLPTREELDNCNLEESYWSLVSRGGYMAASENERFRSLRKNSIYFFAEGSAFKSSVELKGSYTDLQPDWNEPGMHPVWRCGMPIFINL